MNDCHLHSLPWYQKVSELGLVYPDNLNESDLVRIVSVYMIAEAIRDSAGEICAQLDNIHAELSSYRPF